MAKKKVKTTSEMEPPGVTNALPPVHNGLADALGFPGGPPSFPGQAQISQGDTIFAALRFYLISNFRQILSQAYVEIGLIQTLVNVPVDDALRGGIEIESKQLDEDQIKELQLDIDRDDDLGTAGQGMKWNRLFGGGGLLLLTDQDYESPFDLKLINKDSPFSLKAVDMWELYDDKQIIEGQDLIANDPDDEHFYRYYSHKIHETRVMKLKGLVAPSFIRPRLRGWGVSVVEVLVRSINQYLKATDLGFEVLDEFKLDVYKIKNLVSTLLGPGGQAKVQSRIQLANWQKNYQNAVVMDSEDDFDHKQLSFAGLAEAMAGIRMQVAADLRMPITKLFGTSVSAGLGNTDQNDMENYNAMVESEIRSKIKYDILRICEIKCQKLFGFVPDDLGVKFKPLRVLSAEQEENVKTQKFTRVLQAKQAGELTTLEFREACNKGNLLEIQLDTGNDRLNPDDPEIEDVLAGEAKEDAEGKDEPGANKVETEKVSSSEDSELKPSKTPAVKNARYWDAFKRFINSAAFDRASYEADGGDAWIDSRRREFFENPGNVDEGLWARAKDASMKAFGKEKWQFITWWYKKQGGKFE